jgi:putative ABC transport system substrate-binding protein
VQAALEGRRRFLQGSVATVSMAVLTGCSRLPFRVERPPTIGYLGNAPANSVVDRVEAFRQGLRDFGYEEGKNIDNEYRYADLQTDRLVELAADLVRLKIDVIVTGGPLATRIAREATGTRTGLTNTSRAILSFADGLQSSHAASIR